MTQATKMSWLSDGKRPVPQNMDFPRATSQAVEAPEPAEAWKQPVAGAVPQDTTPSQVPTMFHVIALMYINYI